MKRLFLNRFNLIRELGEGSYGMVVLAQDVKLGNNVALKIIQKSSILKMSHINRLRREINLLRLLKHPNIVRLYDVVETPEQMILVMEYISGIDLFDRIIESKRLDEDTARKLYRQLFSAIMYCHDNMIVHRDLKPENLLLDENNNLKIIDFGFVRTYSKDPFSTLKTFCGSMYYCAPEMINGTPYPGPASDIWSLGVILYVITNGYLPFRENNLEDLYESLKVAKYDKGEYSSQECNELIAQMLVADPNSRTDIVSLASNPWLNIGYESIPSHISDLNNDLLQFREEMAKKIDLLESQESAIEYEIKKRSGLQDLSLLIPIDDESVPMPYQMPLVTKCKSNPHEYNSSPPFVVGCKGKQKERDSLVSIMETDSHSPQMSLGSSNSVQDAARESTISSLEKKDPVVINLVRNDSREYCSAPSQNSTLKQDIDDSIANNGKKEDFDWRTKVFKWFHKPSFIQNATQEAPSKRRFSFLLRK